MNDLEHEEYLERIREVQNEVSRALDRAGVTALPYLFEDDIYVEGALTDIVKVYLDWRSEIEELG